MKKTNRQAQLKAKSQYLKKRQKLATRVNTYKKQIKSFQNMFTKEQDIMSSYMKNQTSASLSDLNSFENFSARMIAQTTPPENLDKLNEWRKLEQEYRYQEAYNVFKNEGLSDAEIRRFLDNLPKLERDMFEFDKLAKGKGISTVNLFKQMHSSKYSGIVYTAEKLKDEYITQLRRFNNMVEYPLFDDIILYISGLDAIEFFFKHFNFHQFSIGDIGEVFGSDLFNFAHTEDEDERAEIMSRIKWNIEQLNRIAHQPLTQEQQEDVFALRRYNDLKQSMFAVGLK